MHTFIWGGGDSYHLVKLKTLTKINDLGGLGFHKSRNSKSSVLGKDIWDILDKPKTLWV
jgi:hypothetical protein